MTDRKLYSKYRMLLARKPVPTTSWKYFNRKLSLEEPTEFSLEEIQALVGWRLLLWAAIKSKMYVVSGLREDGGWDVLSKWAREKARQDDLVAMAEGRMRKAQPGRRRGSGVDMLIGHLWGIEGLEDYDEILRVVKACDTPAIQEVVKEWDGKDGREKARKAGWRGRKGHSKQDCRYCREGLPPSVAEALAYRKRRS
ncbi:MAG: hypothetical protein ABSC13_06715 [Dehalococcoidia bacterium]|jgi:hypothetical protein